MLNFNFLEKGLGIVSPLHFVYVFSRKMFLMLHYINSLNFIVMLHSIKWLNFIVWLSLHPEILGNMGMAIVNQGVMSWILKLAFFSNQVDFLHDQNIKRKILKYPENEKSILDEIKSIFHHFNRAFSCQNCLGS